MAILSPGIPLNSMIPYSNVRGPAIDVLVRRYPFPDWMFETSPFAQLGALDIGERFTNLVVGCTVDKQGTTTLGKPFVRCSLYDRSDRLPGVLWATNDAEAEHFSEVVTHPGVIELSGYIQEFPKGSGRRQLTIQSFEPTNVVSTAVLPVAYPDYDVYEELSYLISAVSDLRDPLGSLGFRVLQSNWPSFSLAPAAKYYHHAFVGGLLVHTAQVCRLLAYVTEDPAEYIKRITEVTFRLIQMSMSSGASDPVRRNISSDHLLSVVEHLADSMSQGEEFDRDLCMVGAMLHDVGKMYEYKLTTQIDLHPDGQLLGHIFSGASLTRSTCKEVGLSDADTLHLLHLILSHHGSYEFGSPVRPLTAEAMLLHWADYVASRCR